MKNSIQILEKPDWISWDEIRQCLFDAHSSNRANGVNLTHYQWPAGKIKDFIGDNGVFLVALDGNKVIGTAAFAEKCGKTWYANGRYAYMCFAGILSEYNGRGVYGQLCKRREEIAKSKNYTAFIFDTHIKNFHVQNINKKNGYRFVRFFRAHDHYSVVMAKWLCGCPHSKFYCWMKFQQSKMKTLFRSVI